MSKSALRKELASMTAEQIAQVVMEAYDSSKEAKEYFEYFLNPDGAALCEKALTIIAKEIRKAKWGRSKGRVTVIREQIKKIIAFQVEAEHVMAFYAAMIADLVLVEGYLHYPDTLTKACGKFVDDYIRYADTSERADECLGILEKIINSDSGTTPFRRMIASQVRETVASLTSLNKH